ncbi:MAG: SLC13 family permease [Planctomycetota bacterium]|nr:SLC13 family permease [Planctomycetota bacterium]
MTQSTFTAGILLLLVVGLMTRRIGADIVFLTALAALLVAGVLEPSEAVAGFANPAVITVGLLYIVAQGLKETGAMILVSRRLLGRPKSPLEAQGRLLLPVAGLSAFVNNTPIVAMFLPVLSGWAKQNNLNPSRLFMPLSFAAMLGGTCTLIGTSTNLVVGELLAEREVFDSTGHLLRFEMFTLAKAGIPVALAGLLYVIFAGRWLLPVAKDQAPISDDPREYTTWMRVDESSPIVGKTIEDAGLRHLEGLFLTEIDREDERLVAVGPDQVLRGGDRLGFAGIIESVVDLQQIPGLKPDTEQIDKLAAKHHDRRLIEAVISESSPLVGKSVREGDFRNRYNAVIIAVHRAGERIKMKIGDIVLKPGDTLLLEAPHDFTDLHRNSSAFYLVSTLHDSPRPRWSFTWIALSILAGLVICASTGLLDIMTASLCAAMLMVLSRCCTGTQGRQAVDWQVLIVIGAAFGIANAMLKTNLAGDLADVILNWTTPLGLRGMLAGVYVLTVLLTSVMTNNAAAALIFPIAFQAAQSAGYPVMPFAVSIAIGASSSFISPIGYQTNMMIMGPGGYGWFDFLRFGGPLTLICGVVCVYVAPLAYG